SHPVAGRITALAARYEGRTHATSSTPAESEPWMWGSATLVTVTASTCMIVTVITAAGMAPRRTAPTGPSSSKDLPASFSVSALRGLLDAGGGLDAAEVLVDVVDEDALDHLLRAHGGHPDEGRPGLVELSVAEPADHGDRLGGVVAEERERRRL